MAQVSNERTNERTNERKADTRPVLIRVAVPRARLDTYWSQPWSDVLAAAESGVDGLRVVTTNDTGKMWPPTDSAGKPIKDWTDTALLREAVGMQGDDPCWGKNRTVLYQQNW